MVFVESPTFTTLVRELLSDDSYAALQVHLAAHPDAGDVIRGTQGLRKVRWASEGRGKSGGVRVIYFHVVSADQIRMVLIYPKSAKVDLTQADKKRLNRMLENW